MNEISFLDNLIGLDVSFFIYQINSLRTDLHFLGIYGILFMNKKETRGMETLKTVLSLIISLSTVFGIFTGIVNKLFSKKLQPIEDRIDKEHQDSIKKDMSQLRYTVVSFASDLHNGIPKTRFEFDAIFQFISEYESIIEQLHIKNGLFEEEVIYIKEQYHVLLDKK